MDGGNQTGNLASDLVFRIFLFFFDAGRAGHLDQDDLVAPFRIAFQERLKCLQFLGHSTNAVQSVPADDYLLSSI